MAILLGSRHTAPPNPGQSANQRGSSRISWHTDCLVLLSTEAEDYRKRNDSVRSTSGIYCLVSSYIPFRMCAVISVTDLDHIPDTDLLPSLLRFVYIIDGRLVARRHHFAMSLVSEGATINRLR